MGCVKMFILFSFVFSLFLYVVELSGEVRVRTLPLSFRQTNRSRRLPLVEIKDQVEKLKHSSLNLTIRS